MRVRNEIWRGIWPQFSSAQLDLLMTAINDAPHPLGVEFNLTALPAWIVEKLQSAVAQIEVGA